MKYQFKFVCEANEYGIDPRLDELKIFYNDQELADYISRIYNEDDDYAIYGWTGTKFELIEQHTNF